MMAAAIAFALWFSSTPTPPVASALAGQAAELGAAASSSTPAPTGPTGVMHQRAMIKLVTPAIVDASERWLREFYHSPIGTEQKVVVDGRPLVFVLQWHYHPPGFVGGPTGKHRGVTVFEER